MIKIEYLEMGVKLWISSFILKTNLAHKFMYKIYVHGLYE